MKKVLVTGAAGGLGKAVVKTLLEKEYHVIALDIETDGLDEFKDNPAIEIHRFDITNHPAVKSSAKDFELEEQGLDALICLAGTYDTFPLTESDPEFFNKIMAVNFHANVSLVNALLTPLIKRRGRVIIISSESYKIQSMFQPYMISKAALEAYARAAWQELALKGVWLSVIRPGAFSTPLLNWMYKEDLAAEGSLYRKEFSASLKQSKKLVGKITTPEKVAQKVIRAVTVRRPRRIYRVNNNPLLSLITLLSPRLIDKIIVWKFKERGK